ncbi:MAG TPA: hypothetical protein VEO01_35560, partial [Pseudonocardiaceae bacterium]|nr:hypothetical protein [Pseudonocardiaceae bacterium]
RPPNSAAPAAETFAPASHSAYLVIDRLSEAVVACIEPIPRIDSIPPSRHDGVAPNRRNGQ